MTSSDSLETVASAAVSVMSQVASVVKILAGLISFISAIITFFTGKSKEQKEAERRQKEAKQKRDMARKIVKDRLEIKSLSLDLPKRDELEGSWNVIEENVTFSVRLTRTDVVGKETTLLETTTMDNKVNFTGDEVKYNAKQFTIYVTAHYECNDVTFSGEKQSLSKKETPFLHAPSKLEVESKQDGREVHVTFSQVEYAEDYQAEVLTHDDKTIGSAIVQRPPKRKDETSIFEERDKDKDKDVTHLFHAEKLTSGVPGKTTVRVCARRKDAQVNEFKNSTDLYLVAAPSGLDVSYDPQSQQLSVKWKVKDAQKISSYHCEMHSVQANEVVFRKDVANSEDDNFESHLIIPLSEISDKAKSPYRIRVCSLGVSATLASAFISSNDNLSFLPHVDGITPTYDPQSNQLAVSWVPVTGATKYKVTIAEERNISSIVGNLISPGDKNKVLFDRENIQLKSGAKYVVTVAAVGSDALHLPGLPSTADKKFALLQSPVSVSQEYSFKEGSSKIKVTFQPVADASAHLIEVFNEDSPKNIAGKHVYTKPSGSEDWPQTATYSFDVEGMRFSGGDRFKSRVTAQGDANWINSQPCASSNAFQCGDAPASVALKYSVETSKLMILISSRPGHFVAKLEDTFHKGGTISTRKFVVEQHTGEESVQQTPLGILLTSDEERQGAIYQAFVQNTGDQHYLPSEIKQSNEVKVLDPPHSVTQAFNDNIFTVTWKCVQSAAGYIIRVYNKKTANIASEVNITHDLGLPGKEMKKDIDVDSMSLESNGSYETRVMVLGDEVSIGGASAKSSTRIPSFPSPEEVEIAFNNDTRHMAVSCSSVKDAVSLKLGVVDADKLINQEGNIKKALLSFKNVTVSSSDASKPSVAEFDDSVLIQSLDGLHRGVAQVTEIQGKVSLPSGFSISEDVVAWLRPAKPIKMSFNPDYPTLKITWASVTLALRYLVEILQQREGQDGTTTSTAFSDVVPSDALSCYVSIEKVNFQENDKFVAKVQPFGSPGTVITLRSTAYSDAVVCKNAPTDVKVLNMEDKTVKVTWKGEAGDSFQLSVWKTSESGDHEDVISKVI